MWQMYCEFELRSFLNTSINHLILQLFCSSLPLASTKWVWSTIKLFNALSTHTKQCTAVNKSLQHQEIWIFIQKNLGNAENWTRDGWVRSASATSVLCQPPLILQLLTHFYDEHFRWLKITPATALIQKWDSRLKISSQPSVESKRLTSQYH